MSEQSFEQMLEESFKTIHTGEVVDGTVISVKEDEIVLNIGYKADGIITRSEYTNKPNVDLRTVVSEGDTMKAKVLKVNDGDGQVLLTYRRLVAEEGNKKLEEAYNNKEVITAKVDKAIPGGLSVVIDEARVFIPASLISDSFKDVRPSQLSGGMRQRAALIRTLALEPDLLLLDEPFSALDYQTRLEVCDDIGTILKNEGKTAILVTHDLSEAISMGDRVVVLTKRPCTIRDIITIDLGIDNRTPMTSRNAPAFKDYFNIIWKELTGNE